MLTPAVAKDRYEENSTSMTTTVANGGEGSDDGTDWENIVWTNFLGGLLLWSSVVILCIYCYKRACTVFCTRCCDLWCCCCPPKIRRRLLCCCNDTSINPTAARREHTAAPLRINRNVSANDVRLTAPPPCYTDALTMPKPPAEYYLKQEAAINRRLIALSPKSYLSSPDDDIPELSRISESQSDDSPLPSPSATLTIESETVDQGHVNLGSDIRAEDGGESSQMSSQSQSALVHSSDGGIVIAVAAQHEHSGEESQLPEQRTHNTQHPHLSAAASLPLPVGQQAMVHSFTTGDLSEDIVPDQLPSYAQALQMLNSLSPSD